MLVSPRHSFGDNRRKNKLNNYFVALNKTMIHEKSVTLKQLRALAAIVETGTFTAAADALAVTTPAVSTQLRTLEANLGTEVLKRGPDGHIEITPTGAAVLSAVTDIETSLSHCFKRVEALKAGKEGFVSMGVVSTGKYYAPTLYMLVRDALPGIDIDLVIGNRQDVIDAIRDKAVDIAIMGRPPRNPVVEAQVIGDHPHVLIAPPGHHLLAKKNVTPEDILQETFLCRELGSGTRILMERFLDRIGDGMPYTKLELGTNETIKQAVIAGLGIALISHHTVFAEIEMGRLIPIKMPGLPIVRQWFVVHHADRILTPAAERCRDFIVSLNGEFLPRVYDR